MNILEKKFPKKYTLFVGIQAKQLSELEQIFSAGLSSVPSTCLEEQFGLWKKQELVHSPLACHGVKNSGHWGNDLPTLYKYDGRKSKRSTAELRFWNAMLDTVVERA